MPQKKPTTKRQATKKRDAKQASVKPPVIIAEDFPVPEIEVTSPANDLSATVSFSGGSVPFTGRCNTFTPVSLSYSIDIGNPVTLPFNGTTWSESLSTDDCPDDDQSYSIIVYGWDSDGNLHMGFSIFKRHDE